jgi:DNA-binding transcriptional LysR family regulator
MADFRSLTFKQLRALSETLRHGSVTGAAKALHVTPPAITTQLKLLEESVGAPLFDRSADGFQPTEIGQELLEAALDIDRLVARASDRIGALRSGAAGSFVFGVVSTGKYLAPSIVAGFQREHPSIRVKLSVGNRSEIIRGLEHNEYDLLIMGRPPTHIALEAAVLSDHPHILIAPPDHRLVGDPDILVEDLLEERFLAREPGSGTRLLMDRFLERTGGGRHFDVVEMGTNETIKQAVMAGLGIAIISGHTCLAELRDGRLAVLSATGLPFIRQWFLIHRTDRTLTKAAATFKDYILGARERLFPTLPGVHGMV